MASHRRVVAILLALCFAGLLLAADLAVAEEADKPDLDAAELEATLKRLEQQQQPGGEGFDEDGEQGGGMIDGMDMEQMMAQMNGGGGRRFSRDIFPVLGDVPYIQCEACKLVARVSERKQKYKKTKVTEADIIDMAEHMCDPQSEHGEWISEYDAVEEGDKLVLRRQSAQGNCEEECKTLAVACQNVLDEADSEIAELVYLNKSPERVCDSIALKGRCGKTPPVPADRTSGGDNFKPKSAVDLAMARVNRDMRREQDLLGQNAFKEHKDKATEVRQESQGKEQEEL